MEEQYQIVFNGKILPGRDNNEVKHAIARLYGTDVSGIERLFDGSAHILKKNLQRDSALRYQKALRKAGADCHIKSVRDLDKPVLLEVVGSVPGSAVKGVSAAPCPATAKPAGSARPAMESKNGGLPTGKRAPAEKNEINRERRAVSFTTRLKFLGQFFLYSVPFPNTGPPEEAYSYPLASLNDRMYAAVFTGLYLTFWTWLLFLPVASVILVLEPGNLSKFDPYEKLRLGYLVVAAVALMVVYIYQPIKFSGGTVGQRAMGIVPASEYGAEFSLLSPFKRLFGNLIAGLTLIPLLAPFLNERKKSLADIFASQNQSRLYNPPKHPLRVALTPFAWMLILLFMFGIVGGLKYFHIDYATSASKIVEKGGWGSRDDKLRQFLVEKEQSLDPQKDGEVIDIDPDQVGLRSQVMRALTSLAQIHFQKTGEKTGDISMLLNAYGSQLNVIIQSQLSAQYASQEIFLKAEKDGPVCVAHLKKSPISNRHYWLTHHRMWDSEDPGWFEAVISEKPPLESSNQALMDK